MKRVCATFLTVGFLATISGAEDNPKGDADKIQGTWKVVSIEVRGKSLGDKAKGLRIIITKDKLEFKDGDKSDGDFAYKLDSTKSPKWIDLGPVGKGGARNDSKGIYALDGDELKICHPDPG